MEEGKNEKSGKKKKYTGKKRGPKIGSKVTRHNVPWEDIIRAWQTSNSVAEALAKLKKPHTAKNTNWLRQRVFYARNKGVDLRHFPTHFRDWDALKRFALTFDQETGVHSTTDAE